MKNISPLCINANEPCRRPKLSVHLDADAFFASVEQAADSRLRGKPMAVGGEKRGIIASAPCKASKFRVAMRLPHTLPQYLQAHKLWHQSWSSFRAVPYRAIRR